MDARSAKPLGERFASFTATGLSLLPVLALLRIYEYFGVRALHVLPPDAPLTILAGFRSDLGLVVWTATLLVLPVLLLGAVAPRVATLVHRAALTAIIMVGVWLAQFFAVTFVPLGADLFGYSMHDIRATAMASKGIGALTLVPYLVLGLVIWAVSGRAARARPSRWSSASPWRHW